MTTLEELKQECSRFKEIVKRKKRHLKQCKKVLNFYLKQVQELERRIADFR